MSLIMHNKNCLVVQRCVKHLYSSLCPMHRAHATISVANTTARSHLRIVRDAQTQSTIDMAEH